MIKLNLKNKKIFLSFSFDFRGRLYLESEISSTFYKEFRFVMHKRNYVNFETKFHFFNVFIESKLEKNFFIIDN